MRSHAIVSAIRTELETQATPERAEGEKRYLKSDLDFLGATVPMMRRAVKRAAAAHPDLSRAELLDLVTNLWEPAIFELRLAAFEFLKLRSELLTGEDLPLLERLLRESKTWALVDALCAGALGELIDRTPSLELELDRWATDDDFWIRRSALLVHLTPLRRGEGHFDRFTRYADAMLEEKEFFVRKAIGWVLRDTARLRPELVAAWVGPRTHRMSGVTIREAVKRLPPEEADAFMTAYREKRPAHS